MKLKEIIKPTLILFLICLVTTALLAGTNLLTKDTIAAQAAAAEEASRQVVLPQAVSFEDADGYSIGKDKSGEAVGFIFVTEAKGYGGTIKVMTGVTSGGAVSGVTILSHSETVGLGANAAKEEFRKQYEQALPADGFTVVKSSGAGEGQISAVTGATISSNAVTAAVNEAIETYQAVKGGQ